MAFKTLSQGRGWFDQLNQDLEIVRGNAVYYKLTGINGWQSNGISITQYDTEKLRLINLSGQLKYTGSNTGDNYSGYVATLPEGDYDHLVWQHGYAASNGHIGTVVNDSTNKLKLYVINGAVSSGDNWQFSCTIVQTKS